MSTFSRPLPWLITETGTRPFVLLRGGAFEPDGVCQVCWLSYKDGLGFTPEK